MGIVLVVLLGLFVARWIHTIERQKQQTNKEEYSLTKVSSLVVCMTNITQKPTQSVRKKIDDGNTPIRHTPGEPMREEEIRASVYGAKARITLHVVDSKGHDVSGAEVMGSFAGTKNPAELYKVLTDDSGRVTLGAVHAGYMVNLTISKENYYVTRSEHHFDLRGFDCVNDGRWIPWNPTLEVVLKEKRRPIPMYTKLVEVILPEQNKPIGYDMNVGDLVEPYGAGRYGDIMLTYFFNYPKDGTSESISRLTIDVSHPIDGLLLRSKDAWSDFKALHEAPENGYSTNLLLITHYKDHKLVEKKEVSQSEYLIVKSRVKTDNEGRVVTANYSKIYGALIYGGTEKNLKGGMVRLCYYFNPTPNDRNLEFDGKNNLFNPDWKDDSWPREP